MKRLVLLGGGHSQVEVLRQWVMHPQPDTALTVVSRDLLAPYSGMLPGFIAGHYRYEECHIDVRPLVKAAGARVCQSEITSLDLENGKIICPERPDVSFDVLSINTGSRPDMEGIPGVKEYALAVKPVDIFIQGWERILTEALSSEGPYRLVIVGTGAGGVELALTMHYRLTSEAKALGQDPSRFHLSVITRSDEILTTHNRSVQRRVLRALERGGIQVHYRETVVSVEPKHLTVEDGQRHDFDALIWVTQASAPEWAKASGLATDDRGFILVNDGLQSVSHPNVFAAGDVASMESAPRPKSGVYAVRQGPYLAENLRHHLRNEPLTPFTPQARFLSLLCLGPEEAVASKGPFAAQGRLMWTWKDYIDQKFMRKYEKGMSPMSGDDVVMPEMYCGGCGSKVGQDVLGRALSNINPFPAEGIVRGLDHPDDAAVITYPSGTQIVHTVDHFKAFIDDPYLLGQVTAHHCLSDLYAMGATPHNALASVTLPHGPEIMQEDILSDLLAGANLVLRAEKTALVGGHTTEGEELVFGLTVNGYAAPEDILPKTGIQPGDALILTKPLGTGVLFAADMRKQAQAPWIAVAIASMLRSNRDAAQAFRDAGAHAVTDITGFGLAGHLREMLAGSQFGAEIELDALPMLDGALTCSEAGIRSSLFPQNLNAECVIANRNTVPPHKAYPLLFDPQTSGGLLASIPNEIAQDIAKKTNGWIIGRISDAPNLAGKFEMR